MIQANRDAYILIVSTTYTLLKTDYKFSWSEANPRSLVIPTYSSEPDTISVCTYIQQHLVGFEQLIKQENL